ncbi:MAG: DUF1549 domain-containing protein [Gemmataceae bacterium]
MDVLRQAALSVPLLGLLSLLSSPILHAAAPSPRETAAAVDAAFHRALPPRADDETFLRRVTLDLTGKLPDPDDVRSWTADRAPDKCARLLDKLLHSDAYAINWSRYWRDVATYHTPASGNYLRWELFDRWWIEQIGRNRPWNEIVTALVTASGINDEIAPVNYLTALYGNPIEIAATTSRVFLGVQLQCAQCHDAKTEPWKREQFHQFAAFFGRAKLIQHKDVSGRGTPYAIESRNDGQYGMTDKKAPDHLIPMQPRFLTGQSVSLDASDEERRQALARFLTDPNNPWFAHSYINRVWTALLGWGFYPSVNDVAGSRPRYPEVLRVLEKDWIASGHDMRWLFETIALTRAYQGRLQGPNVEASATAACPARLRPEQVFEALQKALGFDENDKSIPAPAPSSAPAVQRHRGLRNMVYQTFKVDPSLPQAEMQGTIPQALLLMNSALVQASASAKGKTVLADLLAKGKSDEEIVAALYERVLARRPTAKEKTICLRYVHKIDNRAEALEDVLWGLVNSTEFLHKK